MKSFHVALGFVVAIGCSSYAGFAQAQTCTFSGGCGINFGSAANNSNILSGWNNDVYAAYSTIAGGASNTITGSGYSVIAGGYDNSVTGEYASIVGGYGNTANGEWSTVGGYFNRADGQYSVALGLAAWADTDGCFVFGADGAGYTQKCVVNGVSKQNAFVVKAIGGIEFISSISGTGAPTAGVYLGAGSGTWSSLSDRNRKHDFQNVDVREVLLRVAAMPITTWRYDGEASGALHMGPMAQDFHGAFGLGDDDRHVTSIDEEGVAFAAIQGLHQENTALNARVAALEKINAEVNSRAVSLEKANASLEQRLAAIEAQLGLRK